MKKQYMAEEVSAIIFQITNASWFGEKMLFMDTGLRQLFPSV